MSVKVKICGLSERATLDVALDAGADMVGLVFFPRSPRNVTIEQAGALAPAARGRAEIVALTVDADDALLEAIAREIRPDYLQAHGSESPARVAEITRRFGLPVIKAIKVRDGQDIDRAEDYAGTAVFLLFDAAAEMVQDALPGGNGVSFDWSLLAGRGMGQFMLSGGLRPDNVAEAIRITGAPMVDVSSGVESAPGVKDAALIRNFIEAAKSAG